jgi:hypothetical protein
MTALVEGTLKVEKALAEEKGPFALFALFLREDAPDKWDLVVSAPWVEADKESALKLISSKVREFIKPPDLFAVSRVVIVEPTSPAVQAINQAFDTQHSTIEVKDSNFFGLAIKHAHIFASQRGEAGGIPKRAPKKTFQRTRRKTARR